MMYIGVPIRCSILLYYYADKATTIPGIEIGAINIIIIVCMIDD